MFDFLFHSINRLTLPAKSITDQNTILVHTLLSYLCIKCNIQKHIFAIHINWKFHPEIHYTTLPLFAVSVTSHQIPPQSIRIVILSIRICLREDIRYLNEKLKILNLIRNRKNAIVSSKSRKKSVTKLIRKSSFKNFILAINHEMSKKPGEN